MPSETSTSTFILYTDTTSIHQVDRESLCLYILLLCILLTVRQQANPHHQTSFFTTKQFQGRAINQDEAPTPEF